MTHTLTRKKILFLITKSNWGGAQRYVYDLATHLDKDRYEVLVALGGEGTLVEMLHHAHIRTITIASLKRDLDPKDEWGFIKELWQLLKTERPDILHVNSSKAGGIGTLLGRLTRTPRIIFTAHGWAFNEARPFWQRFIIKCLHYVTVLLSHQTIAVSRAIVSELSWPGAPRKMRVINPGRTIGVTYPRKEAREMLCQFAPKLTPHLRDTWIITIAELHPIKQLDVLIRTMKYVIHQRHHTRLLIIGDGEERQRLQSQIAELSLSDTVFLTGAITEAARFLKAADLFVLPSRSESYGYVVHEAGLLSVPIVASKVGGIVDIIDDGITGRLVPSGDSSALGSAIVTSLSSPEAATMADALSIELMKRSVATMVTATCALYELPLK